MRSGRAPEVRDEVQIGVDEVVGAAESIVALLVRKTASHVLRLEVVRAVRRMSVLMSGHESGVRAGARNGAGDDGNGSDDGEGEENRREERVRRHSNGWAVVSQVRLLRR